VDEDSTNHLNTFWYKTKRLTTWAGHRLGDMAAEYGFKQFASRRASGVDTVDCKLSFPLYVLRRGITQNRTRRYWRMPPFKARKTTILVYEDHNFKRQVKVFEDDAACFAVAAAEINTYLYRTVLG
jgi:hypothetical protein